MIRKRIVGLLFYCVTAMHLVNLPLMVVDAPNGKTDSLSKPSGQENGTTEKNSIIGSLNGKGFMIEDEGLGQIFSVHNFKEGWFVIWGKCGSGEPWISKAIYPAKVSSDHSLSFEHSPGQHSQADDLTEKKNVSIRIARGGRPKVFLDGLRVPATAVDDGCFFEVSTESEAIRAASMAAPIACKSVPDELLETDGKWVLKYKTDGSNQQSSSILIVYVDKTSGFVKFNTQL